MPLAFHIIDQQLSLRLHCDIAAIVPGRVTVVETPLRLVAEHYFSYVRALWWMWFADGRSVVSVPPGAERAIARLVSDIADEHGMHDPTLIAALRETIDRLLGAEDTSATYEVARDVCFACSANLLQWQATGDCRRITDVNLPHAEGLWWPALCINESVAYGIYADDRVVTIAYAHKSAIMPKQVADIAVCTAEPYRRHGYARSAVAALVEHFTCTGGEARYTCDIDNGLSIATARSVGFVEYGTSLLMLAKQRE